MRAVKIAGILDPIRISAVWFLCATVGLAACSPTIKSTLPGRPTPEQLAELWVQPDPGRDLFYGVGGARLAPDPSAVYTVIELKRSGFSRGYTVKDPHDREWNAKFPPEAPTEVTASRILWGIGYHQPPIYYLSQWNAAHAPSPNPQLPARFREKTPELHGLDAKDSWSYYRNPFVGTREMNGLLVLQAMLGNSDLKDRRTSSTPCRMRSKDRSTGTSRAIWASRSDGPVCSTRLVAIRLSSSRRRSSRAWREARSGSTTAACHRVALREHLARGRPLGVPATAIADRCPVARRVPRRRLSASTCRSLHTPHEAEDR